MLGLSSWSSARRAIVLIAIIVVSSGLWLALVATHDPDGLFGQSSAAWAQAIGSVGAILAAIVIDQGASRRAQAAREADEAAGRRARVALLRNASFILNNVAAALETRDPRPGRLYEGLALEALKAMQKAVSHYTDRGYGDDAAMVWVFCRAGAMLDDALRDLVNAPIESHAQIAALAAVARAHAQAVRELTDEYEWGMFGELPPGVTQRWPTGP